MTHSADEQGQSMQRVWISNYISSRLDLGIRISHAGSLLPAQPQAVPPEEKKTTTIKIRPKKIKTLLFLYEIKTSSSSSLASYAPIEELNSVLENIGFPPIRVIREEDKSRLLIQPTEWAFWFKNISEYRSWEQEQVAETEQFVLQIRESLA